MGNTGQALDGILAASGLVRSRLQLINAIACQPTQGRTDDDMRQAAKCCQPIFKNQLARRTPALAMGKWAAFAVTKKEYAVNDARGFIRTLKSGRRLIITWHPTYAIWYNPWECANFEIDVDRFARLLRGDLRAPASKIVSKPSAAEVRRFFKANRAAAIDIETGAASFDKPWTGKDPTRAVLKTLGFGSDSEGYSVHWSTCGERVRKVLASELANPRRLKVLHNGWFFDIRVLKRYGLKCL